ncbi:MAG: FtsX-like permease family protein [Acidimicrobiales bacterium]
MFRIAVKNLISHKFRSLALMLTVVLGVSFVSGTYVLTDTITNVFNDIFSQAYSSVDVNVRTASELSTVEVARPPVPVDLLATVKVVPGVGDARGDVFGNGVMIIDANGERVGNKFAPALATSWSENDSMTALQLRQGKKPSGSGEIAIDAQAFADGGFHLGDQITVVTATGPRDFRLVGVAGFGRASNLAGATLSIFDLPTAQDVLQRVGLYDSINVKAADGVSRDILQERIQSVLPTGYEAVTSQQLTNESDEAVSDALGFFKTFLLVFAFIALFVGAFIIYNTFGIVVTQRTRELALLRALGASRRQVVASVVGESTVLGVAASAVGLAAGLVIAAGLKAMLAGFGFDVPSGGLVLLPRTVIVALVGGTLVTTVSAIAPAIRASRVPPIAALHDVVLSSRSAGIRRNVTGAALAVLGVFLVLSGLSSGALASVGLGALMTFVGVAMLAPMFARPVAGALGKPIAKTRGAAGLLARQNAMRSARRTAATASALMIGTALMGGSLILSSSITESVERAVSGGALADLVVRSDGQQAFSPALADAVANVPGVRATERYRIGVFKLGGATKNLSAMSAAALDITNRDAMIDVDVREGDISQLSGDTIAVRRKVAEDKDWSIGTPVTATFPSGARDVKVVALYDENTLTGDYIIGLDAYKANFAENEDFLLLLKLDSGADLRAVQSSVQGIADASFPGLKVQDRDQYIGDVKAQVNQFLGLITALLALAIIIALLGVLITMLLAVFERTHELGLLRAVGMGRRQMRAMVRWEAAVVSVYGAILGLILGVFFGVALTRALEDQGVTNQVLPIPVLIILAVVISLLGVAAAIYPARRAARLNVLDAISHN